MTPKERAAAEELYRLLTKHLNSPFYGRTAHNRPDLYALDDFVKRAGYVLPE